MLMVHMNELSKKREQNVRRQWATGFIVNVYVSMS